jgi:peptidoglycan/LPS O-acetylase OafA/YrhL
LGALTYPLYLVHNSGKAIFIESLDGLHLTTRIAAATAFSLVVSYGVFTIGTRVLRPRLALALDVLGLRR